jgi:hypothetical protein
MTNASGERFGEDRAGAFLKNTHLHSQEEMKKSLDREIRRWAGEVSPADDLTLMDLRFT